MNRFGRIIPGLFSRLMAAVLLVAAVGANAATTGQLTRDWPMEKLQPVLRAPAAWVPYPTLSDRARWERLPADLRAECLRRGETALNSSWPQITATDFLDFKRTGRRASFEAKYFARRAQLQDLVVAECVEGQGRLLDAIADRVWGLCEETAWTLPAHLGPQRAGLGLPDITEPYLDIFAADTAGLLAWTDYLLGAALDRVSPRLRERLALEVERRVLAPGRTREDFWWMGYDGRVPKNWNPWICREWLTASLLLSRPTPPSAKDVTKIMRTLELFVQGLPPDGHCDEGPGYWSGAAGAMFETLDLLHAATGGACDAFALPVVRDAGRYLYRVHIAGDYYVNTGDARARLAAPAEMAFRYGARIGDPDLMALAAASAREHDFPGGGVRGLRLGQLLPVLFAADKLLAAMPNAQYPLLRDSWLPDMQLMTARATAGSTQGLFLSAQAGYNGKAHNHNDTGSFTVYHDGHPVLIDLGPAQYSAKTFSGQRYDIWVNQSGWHNLPTINGAMQEEGEAYAARAVAYHATDSAATLTSDIAGAYPPAAGLISWQRSVQLERGKAVILADNFHLREPTADIVWNFICAAEPRLVRPGLVELRTPRAGDRALAFSFDAQELDASVEKVEVEDPWIREFWGAQVYRLRVKARNKSVEGIRVFRLASPNG